MPRILLFLFYFLSSACTVFSQSVDTTQVDLVDVVLGRKKFQETNKYRSNKKIHFSFFPAPVSTPGGGKAVITSINAAFFLGDPANTNLSNIYLIPFTDFSARYGFYIRPNLWLTNNSWNFIGDYRIAHFPQFTWGLGGDSPEFARSLIDTDFIRVYQNALKSIGHNWFAGFGYALDYHYNIEETDILLESNLDRYYVQTSDPSVSSGVTMNIAYDGRVNAINPPRGSYFIATWRLNTKSLGSDSDYQTLFIDGRKYVPFSSNRVNMLALRSYYWTMLTGDAPYLHLPATNWAPASGIASRGFQGGRYRSNAMLYGEAEHRYQLTANGLLGLVTFMNVSSASEFETQHFKTWKVGAGFGLRGKLNKYSNANVAIDFGFSENYWSVWVNVGEMF
jgi:Omp85 superfamily domain